QAEGPWHASGVRRRDERAGLHAHPPVVCRARARRAGDSRRRAHGRAGGGGGAMTRFLSESRERFLLAIAARLPPERLIELHFFQPMRQGGIESGVAVIAARPERPPVAPVVADGPPP